MAILWKAGRDFTTDFNAPGVKIAKPTFAGAVLGIAGRDVRVMSDVWAWVTFARVWDGTGISEVSVANSEFGGSFADVTVDATPEVLAAAAAFESAAAAKAAAAAVEAAINRVVAEATRIAKGKDVTVVKGRKVPKGTTGRVFWMGESRFGLRVGLELPDGSRTFTAIGNVEVTNPDEFLDVDELLARRAA